MPQWRELPVQTDEKKQALFGLELLMRCRCDSTKLYMPIDWFDVHKMWEKSRRFRFFPHIKADTMIGLFEQICGYFDEHIGQDVHCLLWLSFPEASREKLSVVHEFICGVRESFPSAKFGVGTSTDNAYSATLCIMDSNVNDWSLIERCIQDAGEMEVEQAEMTASLKKTFGIALDALEEMVTKGIDLTDSDVVSHLQELILAICQIPQGRIHAFDVMTVLKEFEEYEERFYRILSLPRQNADSSLTCDWLVDRLHELAVNPKEIDVQRLERYLDILEKLTVTGSDKILARLEEATENLAHELTSEWMPEEAKRVCSVAINLLSRDNVWIIQREKRLLNIKTTMEYI